MKALISLAALVIGTVAFAPPAQAVTRVFLLGGQSNMAGLGGYDVPVPPTYGTPPDTLNLGTPPANVFFWNYNTPTPTTAWPCDHQVCPGVGNGWVPLTPTLGVFDSPSQPDTFGPELSFGHRLSQLFPTDQIYLVKQAVTATDLAVDWKPGTPGGVMYTRFRERVDAALLNLTGSGATPVISGMAWMQGESDALNLVPGAAAAYETNLLSFIQNVRTVYGAPDMPFVMGSILPYWDSLGTVRSAQANVAAMPGMNVALVDTGSFSTLPSGYPGHFGTQGQLALGMAFANEIYNLTPVPEPQAYALALAGLGLVAFATRRRRGGQVLPLACRRGGQVLPFACSSARSTASA